MWASSHLLMGALFLSSWLAHPSVAEFLAKPMQRKGAYELHSRRSSWSDLDTARRGKRYEVKRSRLGARLEKRLIAGSKAAAEASGSRAHLLNPTANLELPGDQGALATSTLTNTPATNSLPHRGADSVPRFTLGPFPSHMRAPKRQTKSAMVRHTGANKRPWHVGVGASDAGGAGRVQKPRSSEPTPHSAGPNDPAEASGERTAGDASGTSRSPATDTRNTAGKRPGWRYVRNGPQICRIPDPPQKRTVDGLTVDMGRVHDVVHANALEKSMHHFRHQIPNVDHFRVERGMLHDKQGWAFLGYAKSRSHLIRSETGYAYYRVPIAPDLAWPPGSKQIHNHPDAKVTGAVPRQVTGYAAVRNMPEHPPIDSFAALQEMTTHAKLKEKGTIRKSGSLPTT